MSFGTAGRLLALASLGACGCAPASTGTGSREIPADFHGQWQDDPAYCGTPSEPALTVGGDSVHTYEIAWNVLEVSRTGERRLRLRLEEEASAALPGQPLDIVELDLALSADGRRMTVRSGDGAQQLLRC